MSRGMFLGDRAGAGSASRSMALRLALVLAFAVQPGCKGFRPQAELNVPHPVRVALPEKINTDLAMQGQIKGDLVVQGNVNVRVSGGTVKYEGTYISGELLDMVQLNHTTGDWLLAVFGQPTDRSTLDDGSEIWRWVYRPVEQEQIPQVVQVTALGVGEPDKPRMSAVYQIAFVQLRNNKVVAKGRG